jgi:hypothetical protein
MTLAAQLRRMPQEIESMGLHDAVTLLQTLRMDEHNRLKFDAALHGCTLK